MFCAISAYLLLNNNGLRFCSHKYYIYTYIPLRISGFKTYSSDFKTYSSDFKRYSSDFKHFTNFTFH